MKKSFVGLFLVVLLVPVVASAAWWNPFSWTIFNRKALVQQVQIKPNNASEEKIGELQKQIDELKKEKNDFTNKGKGSEIKTTNIKTTNSVVKNINPPEQLIDYCPNIYGVQAVVPSTMFIYGVNKDCLSQDEINHIANKITAEKNKAIQLETRISDPIYSKECVDAQSRLKELKSQQDSMDQSNYRALADFAVYSINPALDKVNSDCKLHLAPRIVEPMKSTSCYVNYYGNSANVTCY